MNILRNIKLEGADARPFLLDLYVEQNNSPKPVIIFSHGFKGFKDFGCFDMVARTFAGAGFVFIKYNFSHNGTTVDDPLNFADLDAFGNNNFSKEMEDLGRVIDWVVNGDTGISLSEFRRGEIYLVGHSRGGGTTFLKAAEDTRIKKISTWASVDSFEKFAANEQMLETWKEAGVFYVLNGRTHQQMPLYFQLCEDYLANKERFTIERAAKKLDIPALVVHGTADPTVPFDTAQNLVSLNTKFNLLSIEDGDHVFGSSHPWERPHLPEDLKQVVESTIDFFRGDF